MTAPPASARDAEVALLRLRVEADALRQAAFALVAAGDRLRRERNALLVGVVCASAGDDRAARRVLAAPGMAAAVVARALANVAALGYADYLDLPANLEKGE